MARSTVEELQLRLARLEEENASLRARAPAAAFAPPTAPVGPRRHSRAWARTLAVTVLIALGTLIAPVALVSAWGNAQLTDTDRFVTNYAALATEPAVRTMLTDQVVEVIEDQVDIPALTADVIDGVIELGTGPAATRALELMKGPASQGVRSLVTAAIERFIESDAFANVWASALRVSHSQVVAALQNDPDAAIALGGDGTIAVQLGPIVAAAKAALIEQGVEFAASIPSVDRATTVARFDSLTSIRLAYELVVSAGLWLPWITLLLFAAAVATARRRATALVAASLSLGFMMLIVIAALTIGRTLFDAMLTDIPADASAVIYELVVGAMRDTAIAVLVLALVTAAVGWFSSPFRVPGKIRTAIHGGAAELRTALDRRGLSTGRVGMWLHLRRVPIRVAVTLAGAAVVLLVRPLTPALVLWTLALSLLTLLALEVIERPPDRAQE